VGWRRFRFPGVAYPAKDFPELFAHFAAADVPEHSIYPYSPVFPCRIDGRRAVLKRTRSRPGHAAAVAAVTRQWAGQGIPVVTPLDLAVTNPVRLGEATWVAYPFVAGRPYRGTLADVAAAGDLLGRMHVATGPAAFPLFEWPDHGPESVAEDVAAIRQVVGAWAPGQVVTRLEKLVAGFMTEVLPRVRDARLPVSNGSLDYKANNLVYTAGGPVLVDPDNGDLAPRLLDLALAVLLFHTEHEPAPPRLFTAAEWATFAGAYLRHVPLTGAERSAWPVALDYMLSEYGVWELSSDADGWRDPRQRAFLLALAAADPGDFPLPSAGT
jgi:Ser/Thr protein kinase RdoA (MazF antagonist)